MNHRNFYFNLVLFSLLSVMTARVALAACSDGTDGNPAYVGKATLNEYYHSSQAPINAQAYFVETKILFPSIGPSKYNDWSILICSQTAANEPTLSGCITGNQAIADDNANYPDTDYDPGLLLSAASGNQSWLVLDQTTGYPAGYIDNNPGTDHGMEVFLLDANGRVIDYTSVADYQVHRGTLGVASCNFLFDNEIPGSNTFTVQRIEDGTGCWPQSPSITTDTTINGSAIACIGVTPPTGNSGAPTEQAPNLDLSSRGIYPYFQLTPELSTVAIGGSTTFTISLTGALEVTNSGQTTLTTAQFTTDVDLTFYIKTIDGTTVAPAPTAPATATIPAGATSVTFTIDTSTLSTAPLVDTNFTTYIIFDPTTTFPNNADIQGVIPTATSSLVTFLASGPDHYTITHTGTGITCDYLAVTISAYSSTDESALVAPAAGTVLSLSTSTAVDGWYTLSGGTYSVLSGDNYTFDGATNTVTLYLRKSAVAANIDIDVSDGSATENDTGSSTTTDMWATFVGSLLQFVSGTSGGALATTINNQIGGKPSSTAPDNQNLYLRAVKTDLATGACVAGLQNSAKNVSLGYQCIDPASCSANELKLKNALSYDAATATTLPFNNGATTSNTTAVTLNFDANGLAPLSFQYDNVGKIALYAAPITVNGATVSGNSSEQFIVKPQALVATASGTTPYKAGVGGPVTVKAVLWDSDNTNLTDNPVATLFGKESSPMLSFSFDTAEASSGTVSMTRGATTATLPLTSSGSVTSFTLLNSDFTNGVTSLDINWDEVGTITLSSSSNYLSSGNISATTDIPFIPYDLLIEVSNDGSFINTHTSGATNFTYIGESFGFATQPQFTVKAIAYCAIPPCPVTTNYSGTWASKITSATLPTTDQTGTDNTVAWTLGGITYTPGDFANGIATVTFDGTANYSKPVAPLADFTSNIDPAVNLSLTTVEGITRAQTLTFNPVGNLERYGRAVLVDTYGPTDLPLQMIYYTEYFNGTAFVPNTDDLDTSLTASTNLACAAAFSCSVDGSAADVQISGTAIPPGNSFTLTPTTALSGALSVQLTTPGWLTFDWNGDGTPTYPAASATFGLYRGDDRFYYWREER